MDVPESSNAERFCAQLALLSKTAGLLFTAGAATLVVGYFCFLVLFAPAENRIDRVSVPKTLDAAGATPMAVRHLLAMTLTEFHNRSSTSLSDPYLVEPPKIDFSVPKTTFSLHTLADWVREAFGHYNTSISLDLYQASEGISARASVTDRHGRTHYFDAEVASDLPHAVGLAALDVMQNIDPLVSGAYKLEMVQQICKPTSTCTPTLFGSAIADLTDASHETAEPAVHHRAILSLAHIYAISGDHRTAALYLTGIIDEASNPTSVLDAVLMRGVERTALGDHAGAEQDFRLVTKKARPTHPRAGRCNALSAFAHEDLGNDLLNRGPKGRADELAVQDALAEYTQAVSFCDTNYEARLSQAKAYFDTHQFTVAARALEALILVDGSRARVHNQLGNALREAVLDAYRRQFHEEPRDCGLFRDALAEQTAALAWSDTAGDVDTHTDALLDTGKTHLACGEVAKADIYFRAALDAKPYFKAALLEHTANEVRLLNQAYFVSLPDPDP